MRCSYKVFKSSSGFEDVLVRASEFVTRLGPNRLISINTMIDPSESRISPYGGNISRGATPEEVVVIVWYWDQESVP